MSQIIDENQMCKGLRKGLKVLAYDIKRGNSPK